MLKHFYNAIKRRFMARLPRQIVQVPVMVPVFKNELLKGRTALITGGTTGIGFAMARAFLDSGANVVITGRSQTRIDEAVGSLSSEKSFGVMLDNKNVDDFPAIIDEIEHICGLPDILVNNAGVIKCNTFGSVKLDNYNEIMDANLRGAFFLSQEISNRWITRGIRGNILNIGSSSSIRPGNSPYVLSKWGMRSMTIGLAKTLIKNGIIVNGIAPGPTATSMFVGDGKRGINWEHSPSGRLVTEEEIANLAVILVSDMSRMVVGDMLFVTGGAGVVTVDDI